MQTSIPMQGIPCLASICRRNNGLKRMVILLLSLSAAVQVTHGRLVPQSNSAQEEALFIGEVRTSAAFMKAMQQPATEPNIDVIYYKLDLSITTSPSYLRGVVTVMARSTVAGLTSITLDLMNALIVDSVKTGNTILSFTRQPTTMTLTLDRGYGAGEIMTVDIYYRGVPGSSGFGSFAFTTHAGTPWVYTLSEPYGAKDWWPCKDHPVDKADSVDVWVTVDSSFKVGSNGKLVAVINNGNGTKTHRWAERHPISTYLVSLAITNYAEFTNWFKYSQADSMPVLNYVLPEHLANAQSVLPLTTGMLGVYSDKFCLYPFVDEKYGHSEFGWGGGMEHQTMTSLGGFSEMLVAHELAHQWFGDMITCANWPNIWMNEGFATYCAGLYYEAKYGTSSYWSYINGQMTSASFAVGSVFIRDTSSVNTLFNYNLVYAKGATVLHMLRHVLGDSAFFRSLRSYANDPRFRFGTATTENFRQVCETVSGTPLGYFFNEWIYGENFPRYTYSWQAIPDTGGSYIVPIRIQQTTGTTNPAFFAMPIDFRLAGTGLDTTVVLLDTLADQTFNVRVPRLPTTGQLDPNNWILKTATLGPVGVSDLAQAALSFKLENNYPNPFNPVTSIKYRLQNTGSVRLIIYDVLGRQVRALVDDVQAAGWHLIVWDGMNDTRQGVTSGTYFYRIENNGNVDTRKMILLH